jgi:hypothetical protein
MPVMNGRGERADSVKADFMGFRLVIQRSRISLAQFHTTIAFSDDDRLI